jgi:hypothetical protein
MRILPAICIILCSLGCTGGGTKGPGIRFDKELYDFGEVPEKTKVGYSFTITNTGTGILTLKDLELSCWCVSVEAFDRLIEPGKSGTIEGTVDTEGFHGEIIKTITVRTNARGKEPVLTIRGRVLVKVEVSPPPLMFGDVKRSARGLEGDVWLVNLTGKPMRITGVVPQNKSANAEVSTVEPGKVFSLRVTVRPPFITGSTRESIIVKTDLAEAPEVNVFYDYNCTE